MTSPETAKVVDVPTALGLVNRLRSTMESVYWEYRKLMNAVNTPEGEATQQAIQTLHDSVQSAHQQLRDTLNTDPRIVAAAVARVREAGVEAPDEVIAGFVAGKAATVLASSFHQIRAAANAF